MAVPNKIQELIERFRQNYEAFKSANYNETRARIEFIDPFFRELGWDINNSQGFAEAYKDVIREDAIKVEGSTKAPDYSFRIGGQRKFFLEAKKPAVHIKEDIGPAYQLRRYTWNAGLPVSVLTDFEEFAIYDTTIKPDIKDRASTARIFYCKYDEYHEHWEYIHSIFAKDSVLKGSFDKFVKDAKRKKGTTPVDKVFLQEMENWRNNLAKSIALRNDIDIHALNYVVQAKVEEKPEVKKAGGVYYTPQYIVKYIVENTLGELLKGKTPPMVAGKVKGHSPLRILDPACGSGSFLIFAYQYLLDWHRDWYEKNISEKDAEQARKYSEIIYEGPGGHRHLTTKEKKRILLNNIFGVDIDHQAVEVTKLNLSLKVLEGAIDKLVYELYGLTEEEIQTVEGDK